MGRFVVSSLAFVALLCFLTLGASGLVRLLPPEPATENFKLLFDREAVADFHLWGTSHTLHGVNPCAMGAGGARLHNFALNAATPTYYRSWYADWRRHHPAPQRVYLGLDPLFCTLFPWSRQYEQDSGFWPWTRFLERLGTIDEGAATAAWNRLALIRRRDEIQDRLALKRPAYAMRWDQACAGFVPLEPRPGPTHAGTTHFQVSDELLGDLRRLLQTLRRDGVEVIAFQTPEFRAQIHGYAPQNQRLMVLVREFELAFLNYNVALASENNDDPGLFNDAGHLNARGAERFSRRLASDLRARNLL